MAYCRAYASGTIVYSQWYVLHLTRIFLTSPVSPPDHHFKRPIDNMSGVSQVACLIGVICSVIMGISRTGSDLIVRLLAVLLYSGFNAKVNGATQTEKNILRTVPLGINEVLAKFNLEGRTVTYACCPRCLQTYKPDFKNGSSTP